jgi:hypothetical protein
MLKKSLFSPAQPWCAKTHLSPCIILASFRSSMYPKGYASGLHSLRPCWTTFLSILLGPAALLPCFQRPYGGTVITRCAQSKKEPRPFV